MTTRQGSQVAGETKTLLDICNSCPVKSDCLEAAALKQTNLAYGVGLVLANDELSSEHERKDAKSYDKRQRRRCLDPRQRRSERAGELLNEFMAGTLEDRRSGERERIAAERVQPTVCEYFTQNCIRALSISWCESFHNPWAYNPEVLAVFGRFTNQCGAGFR